MTPTEQAAFRTAVVRSLRAQLGVPFTHQGRCPAQGFDCVGLPSWALLQNGYVPEDAALFNRRRYRAWPKAVELAAVLESECVQVDVPEFALDLCLASLTQPYSVQEARHLMTFTDSFEPRVIHTLAARGGVMEHGFTDEWQMMTTSFWRLKCLS